MKTRHTLEICTVVLSSLAGACSSGSSAVPPGSGGRVGSGGAGGAIRVVGTGGASGAGGSSLVGSCTGTPEYCVMYETREACRTVGCYWSENDYFIAICDGVGSPCATFTTQSSCKFAGCTWLAGVAPVVGGAGGAAGSGGTRTNGGATGTGGGGSGAGGLGGSDGGIVDARKPEVPPLSWDAAVADTADARPSDAVPGVRPEVPSIDGPGFREVSGRFDLPRADTAGPDLPADFGGTVDGPPGDVLPALTKLEIGPACAHLEVGRTFAFKAWGTTASASKIDVTAQVVWTSSKPDVATFSANSSGVATGLGAGDFQIGVSGGGQTATLSARVAAWSTTKLDYDVAPKDFHVMTASLGTTPDSAGLAVAAWLVPDNTGRTGVAYREYDPATATWSAVAMLDTGKDGEVFDVRMRVSPTGNLLALWQLHFPGSNSYEVWATDRVGGTWHAPVRISTQGSTLDEMSLSMNHSGTAMAVWDEGMDPDEDTRVAVYNSTQGWLTPVSIAGTSVEAQIDYDDTNHALALWAEISVFAADPTMRSAPGGETRPCPRGR
jgi:hypothetical protein